MYINAYIVRTFLKRILLFVGLLFSVAGWISWKNDYELPFVDAKLYMIVGIIGVIIRCIGETIGQLLFIGCPIPVLYALLQWLVIKKTTWTDVDGWTYLFISVGMLVASKVSMFLGAELTRDAD